MRQQLLSVFFCVLLSSTLGHEYLRAHELTHKARLQQRSHVGISQFRDKDDNCHWECNPDDKPSAGGKFDITLIILKEISIVAVLNITSNVALAVDLQANIAVLLNGQSGETVLIDLKAETGISWGKGSNDKLWLASQISLTAYLTALGSLNKVKDFPNGQSFEIKSASNEIILRISVILSQLGSDIASRLKVNVKVGLSIVLALSKILVVTLGGSLSILIKSTDVTEIVLNGGLVELTTLLNGLANFAKKINGGLEALLVADLKLKLGLLLGATSSIEALIVLLENAAHKVDLTKVLGPILKSPEAFLEVVVDLGQGLYGGLNGLITIVYQLLLLISNKISISEFIDIIIQLAAGGGAAVSKEELSKVIGQLIAIIQIQISTFKTSDQWQALLKFFTSLKDGNLKVGGIDISAILNLIFESSGKAALTLVVGILLSLSAVVGLSLAIGTLFVRLVFFIISGQGIVYILQLFPSLKLNIDFSSGKSIISQILSSVSLSKILGPLLRGDIVGVIKQLPVLGDIYTALVGALEALGKGVGDLIAGLTSLNILNELLGWIKSAFGLGGGTKPSGGIAGQSIIGGGISININISISGNGGGSVGGTTEKSGQGIIWGRTETASWQWIGGSEKVTVKAGGGGGGGWGFHFKHHDGEQRHHEEKPRKRVHSGTYNNN